MHAHNVAFIVRTCRIIGLGIQLIKDYIISNWKKKFQGQDNKDVRIHKFGRGGKGETDDGIESCSNW